MKTLRLRAWREWTLRSRMVVTVVGLAALALLLSNLVGARILRDYMISQTDTEASRLAHLREGGGPLPGQGNRPNPANTAQPGPTSRPTPYPTSFPTSDNRLRAQDVSPDSFYVIVYNSEGRILYDGPESNVDESKRPEVSFTLVKQHADGKPFTLGAGDDNFRASVGKLRNGNYTLAAISTARVESTVDQMLVAGLGASLLFLLGLGAAAYKIVSLGLRPLTRMETAATEIAAGDLTVRVPDTDPHTEPGRLGQALNSMLTRIESEVDARTASEQRLRQFLADASHELRTPLTSIRGFAELYRRGGAPSGEVLDETMSRIEAEASRMGLLVEDLLLLASLDEERPLQIRKVDLLEVAVDTIRDARVRTPRRTVELASFEPVIVLGDEHRLRQVAANLVANALQHTPPDARVSVRVATSGDSALLEVIDNGPGIPAEHAEHIFERLYRADPHRARSHGGAGLGLAIANAIVKAHGGRIELLNGEGATFRVILPRSAPDPDDD